MPPKAHEVPTLMKKLMREIENIELKRFHPVKIASYAHFKLVHIHPFVDGNGRTARLLMNLILLKYDYPSAVIKNQDRIEYYNALEKAHDGNMDLFDEFIASSANRSLDIYLEAAGKRL